MHTLSLPNPRTGEAEEMPVTFAYALRTVDVLGYMDDFDEEQVGRPTWKRTWRSHRGLKRGIYDPQVEATNVRLDVYHPESMFSVYLVDGAHPSVGMYGHPWDEDVLGRLYFAWRGLPFSARVVEAMIAKCDFLDLNPGYRALPVKHNKTAQRNQGARD